MSYEINLGKILLENAPFISCLRDGAQNSIIAAMSIACGKVLDLAAENAIVEVVDHEEFIVKHMETYDGKTVILPIYGVDDSSILQIKELIK